MIQRDLTFAEADGVSLKLDFYRPDDIPGDVPVVLWVHGGGWHTGDRRSVNAPATLVQHGYAMATIDYRLTGQASWPAQIHDCKAAVRWLRANAKRFGLDTNRIGVWGSSAGGHLVAMLAVSGDQPQLEGTLGNNDYSSAVTAACDWCGPTDLTRLREPTWCVQQQALICQVTEALLGGPLDQRHREAQHASPMTYVNSKCPPMLIMHGLADDIVTPLNSKVFHEALCCANVDSTMHLYEGVGHGLCTDQHIAIVQAFFDRTLNNDH